MSDYEHDGNIFTGYEDELREHREYRKYDYDYEHTDAFEAGMMLSDIDDEWAEEREYSGYVPSHSPRKPKQGQKKSGGTPSSHSSKKPKQASKLDGCFLNSVGFWIIVIIYLLLRYCG